MFINELLFFFVALIVSITVLVFQIQIEKKMQKEIQERGKKFSLSDLE
jgi:hypothetical protein